MSQNFLAGFQTAVVVDSGGLNLRTCFLSDFSGNVISVTEPKAGLGTCP